MTPQDRTSGIVHFLTHQAHRPSPRTLDCLRNPNAPPRLTATSDLEAALPSVYVRTLVIENEQNLSSTIKLEFTLPQLLQYLPQVIGLDYDGPLTRTMLDSMLLVNNMKTLVLRSKSHWRGESESGWEDESINFGVLANLRNLRVLTVGQLKRTEAVDLAKAVSRLYIQNLKIICSGWFLQDEGWAWFKELQIAESPLILFLQTLGRVSDGFPSTLRRMALTDWFCTQTPFLWRLLATSVQPCKSLTFFGIGLVMPKKAIKVLSDLGLPSGDCVIAVRAWERLIIDRIFRTASIYWSPKQPAGWCCTIPLPGAGRIFPKNICGTLDKTIAETYSPNAMKAAAYTFKRNDVLRLGPEDIILTFRRPLQLDPGIKDPI